MHLSHETILYDGCSSMALHDLHDFLRQINGKLMLHTSIKKNIGFLWNEYLQDKTDSTFVFEDVEADHHGLDKNIYYGNQIQVIAQHGSMLTIIDFF